MFCCTHWIKGVLRTHCRSSLFWVDCFLAYFWLHGVGAKVFRIGSQIDFQAGWTRQESQKSGPSDANNRQGTGCGDWSAFDYLQSCVESGLPPPPPRRAPNSPPLKKEKKRKNYLSFLSTHTQAPPAQIEARYLVNLHPRRRRPWFAQLGVQEGELQTRSIDWCDQGAATSLDSEGFALRSAF